MRTPAAITPLLLLALAASNCGSATTSSPTAPTDTTASLPSGVRTIWGWVFDTAYRPVAGAQLLILDGPLANTSVLTGPDGDFKVAGNTSTVGSVSVRVSKEGMTPRTVTLMWQLPNTSRVSVYLEPVESALSLTPGNYTITLIGDRLTATDGAAACQGFPEELLTRSYPATVSAVQPSMFGVEVSGQFPFGFGLGIAGNVIGFTIDGPVFSESLPGFVYLAIAGTAPAEALPTATGSTLTIPFQGSFEYCQLRSAMSPFRNCFTTPPAERIAYNQCFSSKDLMVLAKQ